MVMTEISDPKLSGVPETLLIPLYIRALESKRPDALIKDEKAVALVKQMDYDFSRMTKIHMDEDDQLTIILRNREFDRQARVFLDKHPEAVIVHIGCGLDSRFERVDNGKVDWFDLDLREVIELRRKYLGNENPRHHYLPFSVFDDSWIKAMDNQPQKPVLFLAEGVFVYFEKALVKSLVLTLRDNFPGAELIFDAFSPYLTWANNLRFKLSSAKFGVRYPWGLSRGKDVEKWGSEITLLDEWFPFDKIEPRTTHIQWIRHIPLLAKVIGIYHFQLGKRIG
jgi:O-methyltransferase involved in polyketide biosynthesis